MARTSVGGPAVGLPPGVEAGPLGSRFVAYVIDRSVPAVVGGVAGVLITQLPPQRTLVAVIAAILILAWGLLVWQMYAVRAAGPGMRLLKLQLVGYTDGRPIGWGRFFLRWLVLTLLAATGIGLLLMIIFLILQPRRQGWHDLAADSVVIKERALAPPRPEELPAAAVAPVESAAVGPLAAAVPSRPEEQPAAAAGPMAAELPPQPAEQPAAVAPAESSAEVPTRPEEPAAVAPAESAAEGWPRPAEQPAATVTPVESAAAGPMAAEVPPMPAEPAAEEPAVHAPEEEASSEQPVAAAAVFDADRRPLDEGWMVVLDDGRHVDVHGLVLLGRNPQPRAGEEDAQLIKVADETRTVSKSHLALNVDGNGMYVMDRGSTNGSTVTTQDGLSQPCPPGDLVSVHPGAVVSFGDHWLEVRRP